MWNLSPKLKRKYWFTLKTVRLAYFNRLSDDIPFIEFFLVTLESHLADPVNTVCQFFLFTCPSHLTGSNEYTDDSVYVVSTEAYHLTRKTFRKMVENLLKDHEITTRPYEKRKKFDDQFADSISFNFSSSIVRVAAVT